MRLTTPAIVVALRTHGEHGAVVRLLTPDHGLQPAYVRGARGRRMRAVLVAGNQVEASLSARSDGQLAQAEVEPEPELAQHQQLIAHQRRTPAACRRRGLYRREQPVERQVKRGIRLPLGERGRGQRARPVDRGGGEWLGQQRRAAVA